MKITIDLDSTLCNFVETWNLWCYEKGKTKELLFTEEITTYDWHKKNLGEDASDFYLKNPHHCYRQVKPYVGAKDFINYCIKTFKDVEILSHSCNDMSSSAKINFCIEHFDFYNVKFSDSTSDKYKQTAGRILIDDYPPQVIKHTAHNNSAGIVFNLYKKFGWSRLKDYDNLIAELNPNSKLLTVAYSYADIKKQLEIMKNEK